MSKKKAIILILTALFVIVACGLIWFILYGGKGDSDNAEPPENVPKTADVSGKSIADFIASEPSLTNFNKLIKAAGEDGILKTTANSYVVIAPINKAFNTLPNGYFESLLTADKMSIAQNIAKYHIAVLANNQITAGQKLKTQEGQEIIVGKEGDKLTFTSAKGDTALALKEPFKTANGQVYVVNHVMLPQ